MKETSRKLNIAIYLPTASFILGGGEIVSLIKAQYLSAIGHKVSLISLKVNKIQPYFDSFRHDNPIKIGLYLDRKSTRLNSSHQIISYAVFCLKKKNKHASIVEQT